MPKDDPAQLTADNGAAAGTKTAGALVPVVETAQWSAPNQQPVPPNAIFVTHLIATKEQVPQTRGLRRASLCDADSAYKANQHRLEPAGIRARQIV
jgi:hypothetical protein